MLAVTASRVVLADYFGAYLDKRELQGALQGTVHDERPSGSDHSELWFDFVADIGDGFDATYSVAYLLGQEHLMVEDQTLQRGRFLMMGGDEVYPTPTSRRYENKTKGPYEAALPVPPASGSPNLYALPGNHDWYDGLTGFMRLFVKDGKDHVGGWTNAQSRSYFAIQLPHRWWLFAVDTQAGAYIDDPQLQYFHAVAAQVQEGDRIILCGPSPSWVEAVQDPGAYDSIDFFVRTVLKPTGASIKVMLSGDLHHYARYANEDRELIHCGGGGAYLYPTHRMPEQITVPQPASLSRKTSEPPAHYELRSTFPTKAQSRRYAAGVFGRLPRRNFGFVALLGTLQTMLMCSMLGLFSHHHPVSALTKRWLELPIGICGLLIVVACVLFAKSPTGGTLNSTRRTVLGTAHGAAQIGLGVLGTWLWETSALPHTAWPWPVPLTLIYLIVAGLASTMVFCAYLLIASALGVNVNELFSAQAIIDSKSFLRMHIDPTGKLTIYPIAVPRVSRSWVANPDAHGTQSWLVPRQPIKYQFAESPIEVK